MSEQPSEQAPPGIRSPAGTPLSPRGIRFSDRRDAGRRLAGLLEPYRIEQPVVACLPRGGAPVAAEVARALGAPLDVAVVRKIGAPQNSEYAIGAVAEGGVHVLGHRQGRSADLTTAELRMTPLVLLQQIYDQFTEGFATPDLRDAKTLLDELGITGGPRP